MKKETVRKPLIPSIAGGIVFFCLIILLSAGNYRLMTEPVRRLIGGEINFEQMTKEIVQGFSSDNFWRKNNFIDLNGFFARLSGREHYNNVWKLKNGMLASYEQEWDMTDPARSVADFSDYLQSLNTPFLYVQQPVKMDLAKTLKTDNAEDYNLDNADSLLSLLRDRKVNTLDLRTLICADRAAIEKYFYRTDHHWSQTGALAACPSVLEKIGQLCGTSLDLSLAAAEMWEKHVVEQCFIGSWGRRVGAYFGGLDDFIYYTPRFSTDMSYAVMDTEQFYEGDFSQAYCRFENLEGDSYWDRPAYSTYLSQDYGHVKLRNRAAPNQLKMLVFKDSFSLPLLSLLSASVSEIDVIDPRYYAGSTLAEYAYTSRPDLVVMMINPSMFTSEAFFTFGAGAAAANLKAERIVEEIVSEDQIVLEPGNGIYNGATVHYPLKPNHVYTLTVGDIQVTSGSVNAVSAGLLDGSKGEYVSREMWDLSSHRDGEDYTWRFIVPGSLSPDSMPQLRVFAGLNGQTMGNGLILRDVSLLDESMPDDRYCVFAEQTVEITPQSDAYRNIRLNASLWGGKQYELTVDNVEFTQIPAQGISAQLWSMRENSYILNQDFMLRDDRSVHWVFTLPDDGEPGGEYKLQLFAGLIGNTQDIGVLYHGVSLKEWQHPFGRRIFHQDTLYIGVSDDIFNASPLDVKLESGKTYTVCVQDIWPDQGNAEQVTVNLYSRSQGASYAALWNAGEKDRYGYHYTFTVPGGTETAENCELLLYSGIAGAANGVSLTYHDISVYEGEAVPKRELVGMWKRIPVSAGNNGQALLPCLFFPARNYSLSIGRVENAGRWDQDIIVKIFSNREPTALREIRWNFSNGPLLWYFILPDGMVSMHDCVLRLRGTEEGEAWGEASLIDVTLTYER